LTLKSTILPGLHWIELPLTATRFSVGPVNAYLAEGDPLTLIDCGVSNDECYQALTDALAAKGYAIKDVRRLIITHHHIDHRGLAGRVARESGADVWAHPFGMRWLEDASAAYSHLNRFTNVAFREGGVPQHIIEVLTSVNTYMERLSSGSVRVCQTLNEGDSLELAGCRWRVYHTPGHAGDMLCFYQPDSRVLLSSDHLLRDVSSNPLIEAPESPGEPRPKRLLDYMREMRRMTTLDAQIAYGGHGDPITDIPALVKSRLAFHQKRADRLYDMFGGEPRYLYELTRAMFPTVPDTSTYLTLSEVLGHIDMLERDGRLTREMRDGVVYWRPVPQG